MHTPDADPPLEASYYRSLLELGLEDDPGPLLENALHLLVGLTSAREGFIELNDPSGAASWSATTGCDAARVEEIRAMISRGIIAEAIATGETVLTASALDDPRFGDRESVQRHAIEAVICAPLGHDEPLGVVYLQGGEGLEVAALANQRHVAYFARAIGPILEGLLIRAQRSLEGPRTGPFAAVRCRSRCMLAVIERLRLAAPLEVHVLFTGATGVGKTLLAQATHAASGRRALGPFVELNCAAIPEALVENELFGAEAGAHSATPRGGVVGKVQAAEGGTLFLDEISELSLPSQAKLLQLLQSKEYFPLGSSKPRRADVRVLAATNLDLRAEVEAKRFREDLYFRLNVLEVRVPSLAEREEDITPLAHHFVAQAAAKHGFDAKRLSSSALRAILYAEWPGNVRELANRLESSALNAQLRGATVIETSDVFPDADAEDTPADTLQEATRRFQRRHVLSALEASDWNVSEAARALAVARSHVYNLIKAHGLRRQSS